MRCRHRLSKFLLLNDRPLPDSSWDPIRREWIAAQHFKIPATQRILDNYLHIVQLIDARTPGLEAEISYLALEGP